MTPLITNKTTVEITAPSIFSKILVFPISRSDTKNDEKMDDTIPR
jgi:hypothetical protein